VTRYNRSSGWKLKATAGALAVVGGVAGGVALTNHAATPIHDSAYAFGFGENGYGAMLNSAMANLSRPTMSTHATMRSLQELAAFRGFGQQYMFARHHHRSMLAFQRGQIVLITHHFLILRGLNGKLTVWKLTGNTAVKSVATTATAQAVAPTTIPMLTAATAARAVTGGTPVTTMLNNTAAPAAAPTTITVTTGTTTVTVTVTSTATVARTATVTTPTATTTMPTAALTWHGLAAGDVVFVAGSVRGHSRTAQLVLIEALATTTPTATPTVTPTVTTTPSATTTTPAAGTATTVPAVSPSAVMPTHS
jgi:hypothetical protein